MKTTHLLPRLRNVILAADDRPPFKAFLQQLPLVPNSSSLTALVPCQQFLGLYHPCFLPLTSSLLLTGKVSLGVLLTQRTCLDKVQFPPSFFGFILFASPRIAFKHICIYINITFFTAGMSVCLSTRTLPMTTLKHRNSELTAIAQEVTQLEYS